MQLLVERIATGLGEEVPEAVTVLDQGTERPIAR